MTTDASEVTAGQDSENGLRTVALPALHHIALTVTDLSASIRWYEQVLGLRFQTDIPHQGGLGSLLADEARNLIIVLHRHERNDSRPFHETVTGLDHVGLRVPQRDDLVAWQAHLEAHGVERRAVADAPSTQSPISDEPYASVLVFRDPDNIQLELSCPTATAALSQPRPDPSPAGHQHRAHQPDRGSDDRSGAD